MRIKIILAQKLILYKAIMKNKTVLICDDDKILLETYTDFFDYKGFVIHKAIDGREALKIINNEELNYLITDYDMPYLTGIDLYRYIKENNLIIPSILITGNEDEDIIEEAKKLGITDILFKPIQLVDLEQIIINILL
jgi:DNA-binding NtrC family response regulator